MLFIALTFIAALSIETIGTIVSVIGLSTLFGSNPIIIALAVALDVGKLVVVALLYKYWAQLSKLMKVYGLLAAFVTMVITSAGAAGYLSGEFQKAIVGTQENALKVEVLKEEQARLQKRKEQIDQQIASLPERFTAAQRVRMINQFKSEQSAVTARLAEIDKELPTLKISQINSEAKAGPILYIAKAFGITVEEAVKWVILMIIFVFDPLAVFLIVAGNFLLERKKAQSTAVELSTDDLNAPNDIQHEKLVQPIGQEHDGPVAKTYNEIADNQIRLPREDEGAQQKEEPGEITKSTLGIVRPDPTVKMQDNGEIGYKTGVYRSGSQSK